PERFDGALTVCSDAGDAASARTDLLVAGAFAAGVTQGEFDTAEIRGLIDTPIRAARTDPSVRARFEAILVQLSGGPRPFVIEGLHNAEAFLWDNTAFNFGLGFLDNAARANHRSAPAV